MGNAQGGDKEGKCGYRVLGVQPNSPASKVGLVSFFDFIVAADGEFVLSCCFGTKRRDVGVFRCTAGHHAPPLTAAARLTVCMLRWTELHT